MNDTSITKESMQDESIETLILMSELGQDPYRSQAIRELRRRKVNRTQERLADVFMMLL